MKKYIYLINLLQQYQQYFLYEYNRKQVFSKAWNQKLNNTHSSLIYWMYYICLASYYFTRFKLLFRVYEYQIFWMLMTKSFINTIETYTKTFVTITDMDFQYYAKIDSYGTKIFQFMNENQVQLSFENDDCLQRKYMQTYYNQFCYGIYGNSSNIDQLVKINNFTKFMNTIIPFFTDNVINQFFTFSLDDSFYYSQNNGQYQPQLNQSIIDGRQSIKNYNLSYYLYFSTQDLHWYTYNLIDDFVQGFSSYQGSDYLYQMLTIFQENEYYVIDKDGYIIYNNKNFSQYSVYFQDENLTGFNQQNLDHILSVIDKNQSNGCQNSISNMICIQKQLIFYQKYQSPLLTYYFLLIMDDSELYNTKINLIKQIDQFTYSFIIQVLIVILIAFIICFILQFIIIQQLNIPIYDLEKLTKYHLKNSDIILEFINPKQNYILKLRQSVYLLFQLKHRERSAQFNSHKFIDQYQQKYLMQNLSLKQILFKLKKNIKQMESY